MADSMPTIPASKQIFKCEGCGDFFRVPQMKKGGLCPQCFGKLGEDPLFKRLERVDEDDGC